MTDKEALLKEFKDAKESYKKLVSTKGKLLLSSIFKAMFDTVPQVKRIGWSQWTPYFNDGDSCEFTLHERYFDCGVPCPEEERESDDDEDTEYLYDWAHLPWDNKRALDGRWNGATKKSVQELKALDNKLNELEDVFEDTFGDHVKVIATLDEKGNVSFEVEEEEHD